MELSMLLTVTRKDFAAALVIASAFFGNSSTSGAAVVLSDGRRAEVAVKTDDALSESGIAGLVNIRPVRPHQTIGTSNVIPYQAKVEVLDSSGKVVTTFESNAAGDFHVALPPGKYTLRPQSPGLYPRASEQTIIVAPRKFTQVRIIYDSGMR